MKGKKILPKKKFKNFPKWKTSFPGKIPGKGRMKVSLEVKSKMGKMEVEINPKEE